MREINIMLWYHQEENDWSLEFAGRLHRHVSTNTVDELVEYAGVAAQEAEMEPAVRSAEVQPFSSSE